MDGALSPHATGSKNYIHVCSSLCRITVHVQEGAGTRGAVFSKNKNKINQIKSFKAKLLSEQLWPLLQAMMAEREEERGGLGGGSGTGGEGREREEREKKVPSSHRATPAAAALSPTGTLRPFPKCGKKKGEVRN